MTLSQYLSKVEMLYEAGIVREHSYSGDLQNLIMTILPDILLTNEPATIDCGTTDDVLPRKNIPLGYIEAKDRGYVFPLYLYPEASAPQALASSNFPPGYPSGGRKFRTPKLSPEIIKQIADGLGLSFTNQKEPESEVCFANSPDLRSEFKLSFAAIDILDYIYAVLYSQKYHEKYKNFLRIDFPRVPFPNDTTTFWQLVKLGDELRQIHLLESPTVEKYSTQYPEDGNNVVTKPRFENSPPLEGNLNEQNLGKVYINETQYFANVPEVAWNFYIDGYQPAQKWFKDRKGRELSYDDIVQYQKVIAALSETDRIMKEIDKIKIQ